MAEENNSDLSDTVMPNDNSTLHRQAEEILLKRQVEIDDIPPADVHRIVHELRVYEIELELQNDELRRTRQELEATRKKYFDLYNMAPVAYITLDEKGIILEASDTAVTLLGVERGRLCGQPLTRYIYKDDLEVYSNCHKRLTSTCTNQTCEIRIATKDVDPTWVKIHIDKTQGIGDAHGLRVVIIDITERKKAEQSLGENEGRLRALVHTIPDLVWVKDLDGIYLYCNSTFERLYGAKEADIVGKTDYDFVDRELANFFRANDRKAMELGKSSTNEEWLTFADTGYSGLFDTIKTPMYDEKGKLIGVLGIARDVTERKQTEEALRESEKRLRVTLEAAKIAIWDWNILRDVWYASPQYFTMLGYEAESGPSDRTIWLGRIHPQDREYVASKIRRVLDGQDDAHYEYEVRMLHADGLYRWHRVIGQVVERDEHGKATRMLGVRMDITERKHSEQEKAELQTQLLQAQKMEAVGQLAGGIAHDFNNILSAIVGYAYLVQARLGSNDPSRDDIDQILESAHRGAEVTHSLLAFSRKQSINLKPVLMNDIVKKSEKMLSRIIGEDITINTSISCNEARCLVDAAQIEQVLMNLATNARDSMPNGGILVIRTSCVEIDESFIQAHGYGRLGAYVLLSVSDSGVGMSNETVAKIFEPFFTTKETGKGTGLGLAMVYGIVKQHDGYINVYSELGKGTTFNVYLPIAQSREETTVEAVESSPTGGTETILVTEDDAKLRRLSEIILKQHGYKVIVAADGEEAIEKFIENMDRIDLILLDMIMPKMNGKQVYGEITKVKPGIKVIFVSGYTADRIDKESLDAENVNFLFKPVSPKSLLRKVRNMLDK